MQTLLSILTIYIFILIGFLAKHSFKKNLDEKTLVLLSIYFLQPFLILWGFSSQKLSLEVVQAPFIFFLLVMLFLIISIFLSKLLFKDKKDSSIFIVSSIVGNTGNLGIPLGMLLFGERSIIYTTFINIVNIFIVYIIGVYFYSRGNFTIKESLQNILKLPAIWFTGLAIVLNLSNFHYPLQLELPLKMGAYATMVVQLVIFGAYLRGVNPKGNDWKMFWSISLYKFVMIPLLSIMILRVLNLDEFMYKIIILELIVPIAVMNVNLASLYECRPQKVAFLTFATSVIFIFYLFLFLRIV